MASNAFCQNYRVTTFGESHGRALGVVVDGLRPGIGIDLELIRKDLQRRRPGRSEYASGRAESDDFEVLSGIFEGKTTGAPIALIFENKDANPADYDKIKNIFRPGHADWGFFKKYGIRDWRGGGRSSGRETVCRVAAGSIAKQVLCKVGVEITGHVIQIGEVAAPSYLDDDTIDLQQAAKSPLGCACAEAASRMADLIRATRGRGDSLGGIIEIVVLDIPGGWGDPIARKLDADLGAALLSIGAVKGIEFGGGFSLARSVGSRSNDQMKRSRRKPSEPEFLSNHAGGILGGISTGQPLICRVAIKPTPSIDIPQEAIDIGGNNVVVRVGGRHDPCIAPRVVPVAEAMVALVLCDAYLRQQALIEAKSDLSELLAEMARVEADLIQAAARRKALAALPGPGIERRSELAKLAQARRACARTWNLEPALVDEIVKLIDQDGSGSDH